MTMSDEFKRMLDQTIEQKRSQDALAQAKAEREREQEAKRQSEDAQARTDALLHWDKCLQAVDEVVADINGRSHETGIICDQSRWEQGGSHFLRLNFHSKSKKGVAMSLTLTPNYKIQVDSVMGPREFQIKEFGPTNVFSTANNIFSAILRAA